MRAKSLMIQGTSSNVGKSLLVAALCRIYTDRGFDVAPFKSQNMALNSYVTPDGLEIGRAQALQAAAARKEASVLFNPILLKPESDGSCQVVCDGKPWKTLRGRDYYQAKPELWGKVETSLERLRSDHELIFVEGAGSPAEINLNAHEIVNMRIASYLDAPVLLTADIDRGGVFAFPYGTLALLPEADRSRVKGFLINKFRGDISLLEPGLEMLTELTGGLPTLGVIPYMRDLLLAQEDSVFLEENTIFGSGPTDIAVICLPHISNYDDLDALTLEEGLRIRFIRSVSEFGRPDLVILPGTKTTIEDLKWMKDRGLDERVRQHAREKRPVVGICGGYQLLGNTISDPDGVEGSGGTYQGLGLLPIHTVMASEKQTIRAKGKLIDQPVEVSGYEIHMGKTSLEEGTTPLFELHHEDGSTAMDGAVSPDGSVLGTYIHGLFDSSGIRRFILEKTGWQATSPPVELGQKRDEELDRLAQTVREHMDMDLLDRIIGV